MGGSNNPHTIEEKEAMTAPSHTSDPAATSHIGLSGFAALAIGSLACLSGAIPTVFVLLTS